MTPLLAAIAGAVLLVLLIVMFILSRIKVAGPNEAFIVTGPKGPPLKAGAGREAQGGGRRGDAPAGGPALPAPAGPHRGVHRSGAGRFAARRHRAADGRGDHPRPGRVRRARRRGGRAHADPPGAGA